MVSGQLASTTNLPPPNSPALRVNSSRWRFDTDVMCSLSYKTYIKLKLRCSTILQNGKGTRKLCVASQLWNVYVSRGRCGESPHSFWASLFPFHAGYASRFGQFQWRDSCSAPGFLPSTFFSICMPHAPFAPLDGDKQTVATGWRIPGIAIWLSLSFGTC